MYCSYNYQYFQTVFPSFASSKVLYGLRILKFKVRICCWLTALLLSKTEEKWLICIYSSQLTKTEDSNVYATDAILSTIMCCTRSSNSWDVVVQKIAGKLFFDKRDDSEFGKVVI